MGILSSPRFAALQVLLRAVGGRQPSRRAAPAPRESRAAVEVVSDYGVAPSFPGMR
jgi:hypothetical protein